ncbi:MAG: hypothetical protein JXM70_25335 [Pirellulales bacterium]|nr:hypothetical protein [Pirellulales bacterium]
MMKHMLQAMFILALAAFMLALPTQDRVASSEQTKPSLDDYNVTWTSPSKNSSGSMPLGNGDIGLNVWAEAGGDLLFYIGKTDAYSGIGRLLKLGRVRVKLTPNPFEKGLSFEQTLRLREGRIEFVAGKKGDEVRIEIWVDANRPVIHVDVDGRTPLVVEAKYETWREKPRMLTSKAEKDSARGIVGGDIPFLVEADTIVDDKTDRIIFYHRNSTSICPATMKHQALGHVAKPENDPLMHRTFGGLIEGKGFVRVDKTTLRSASPTKRQSFSVVVKTAITKTARQWIDGIEELAAQCAKNDPETAAAEHEKWWNEFWSRSHVFVSPSDAIKDSKKRKRLATVTRGYILQRFISACSGRGALPIKFNGSIFTVDAKEGEEIFDADYRRWGGGYWLQNTRLPYWAMLESGDFDMMRPFFQMYVDALPLAKVRSKTYYKHGGAYYPETMYFWGMPENCDYRWERGDAADGDVLNPYIRYYWSGGLEVSMMALDLYEYQRDREFLDKTVVPLVSAIIEFYDQHYGRDKNGKIKIAPSQSLETYHIAENPSPVIAGLKILLQRMLSGRPIITS